MKLEIPLDHCSAHQDVAARLAKAGGQGGLQAFLPVKSCVGCKQLLQLGVKLAGTVLAAEVKPEDGQGSGYTGTGSKAVVLKLREMGVYARPLGNVVYLMGTPTTSREQCAHLLQKLLSALT